MVLARAAIVEAVPGAPVITEVELDEPMPDEVLVRVVACGVCHSDLASIDGTMPMFVPPFVLGHEPAGIVEAVGAGVKHLAQGDHVVASLAGFCGHCPACASGRAIRCTGRDEARRPADAPPRLRQGDRPVGQHCDLGAFADHVLVDKHNVVRIDPALPLEQACLLGCGVLTGVGAVLNTSPVRPGDTVAVIGCGGVGLAVIQGARLSYAGRIVAVDLDDDKLAVARTCGATDTVNAGADDPVVAVTTVVPGGVDHVFEAIGRPETAQQGLAMLAMHGSLTMVGLLPPTAQLTVGAIDLLMGRSIRQSLMGSARTAADIPMMVEHALAGRLDLGAMISAVRSLDDLPAVLDDLAHGRVVGRAVVTP
jgi:S-(hydroxymethyl)glutathione dehydrogenase/alcohol dehydrogenase